MWARGVDRLHPGQAEIPGQVRRAEGREEASARPVHMDRHVEPGLGLELVKGVGDRLHRLVLAGEGDAEGGDHADGVLVDPLEHFRGVEDQPVALHGDLADLDVEIAGELVPADLHGAADHVELVGGFSGRLARLAPAPFEREPAQHRRLGRSDGGAAKRGLGRGRIPQIGDHAHAARLDLRRPGIFVLVDRQGHQVADLVIDRGLAEGREVLAGMPSSISSLRTAAKTWRGLRSASGKPVVASRPKSSLDESSSSRTSSRRLRLDRSVKA